MQPIIEIKGVSVSYNRKTVLKNVYLDIPTHTVCGVLGQNGAGKSTLFKAILGLTATDGGSVTIAGAPAGKQLKQVVYIPQKGEIDWQFPATVMDVVLMGRYPHRRLLQPLTRDDRQIATQALEDMGIAQLAKRQIGELSGGQQQRVFLARAIAQQAPIFLLDEPFVGVDVTTEEKIIAMLKNLAAAGKTILVIHHDLSKVHEYFDRVILLNQRLIAAGTTTDTFTDANIKKAYGGQLNVLHHL